MADRAGSVASIQADVSSTYVYGGGLDTNHPRIFTSGGSIIIKVTSYEIDYEQQISRILTSGSVKPTTTSNPPDPQDDGVICGLVSMVEYRGGILRARGFVDPTDASVQILLLFGGLARSIGMDLINVNFYIDNVSSSPGSRYGYEFGVNPAYTPNNTNAAKLIPLRLTGRTDDDGMQEIEFELHSQCLPLLFANNF